MPRFDGKTLTCKRRAAEAARLARTKPFPVGCRARHRCRRRAGGRSPWRSVGRNDHMNADALLKTARRDADTGMMLTTPNEARVRADRVLLVVPACCCVARLITAPVASTDGARS